MNLREDIAEMIDSFINANAYAVCMRETEDGPWFIVTITDNIGDAELVRDANASNGEYSILGLAQFGLFGIV